MPPNFSSALFLLLHELELPVINQSKQMNYSNIIVATLMFLPIVANAQVAKDKMAYMRYEGSIGSDISLTANIVQLFDKLTGNYQYRFVEDNDEMYFGKTVEVSGDIDENSNAKLKEFGRSEYTFTGTIKGKKFEGIWVAGEDRTLPFVMNEYYPNGSISFDVHYLHSEGDLVKGKTDSPSADIELTLIYPTSEYIQPDVADSVKKIITHSFFGSGFSIEHPDSMLVKFESEYLGNYVKQNKDWHEVGGASFNWEKVISMAVVYNSGYMLCLEYLKYAYSGGSHGMTNVSYDIIYLDDGKLLTFADVFEEETGQSLSELLTKQLRKDYSIPDNVSLEDAGFFVEVVEPNRNIYVNGNGVGFLYNSYEIAPYSQGATNIFLEWNLIKDLVTKGTPVFGMSRR